MAELSATYAPQSLVAAMRIFTVPEINACDLGQIFHG